MVVVEQLRHSEHAYPPRKMSTFPCRWPLLTFSRVAVGKSKQSPDEEMKKIVLKVVKQCVGTDGVDAAYVKEEILPEYFRAFWVRRMALDRRNHKQVRGMHGWISLCWCWYGSEAGGGGGSVCWRFCPHPVLSPLCFVFLPSLLLTKPWKMLSCSMRNYPDNQTCCKGSRKDVRFLQHRSRCCR